MKEFLRKFIGFAFSRLPILSASKTCLTSAETTTNKKISVTEVDASKSLQFWTSVRAALKLSTYFCIVSGLFGFYGLFLIRRVTNWVELTFAFRVGQSLWAGKREVVLGLSSMSTC